MKIKYSFLIAVVVLLMQNSCTKKVEIKENRYIFWVEDQEIYQKAIETNRFVVTINFDDFKKLIKKGKPGIIGIRSQLTNADIDALLSRFVSVNKVKDCIGKAIKI